MRLTLSSHTVTSLRFDEKVITLTEHKQLCKLLFVRLLVYEDPAVVCEYEK